MNPDANQYLHYRSRFGVPTACGFGFSAYATDDWGRVTCPGCLTTTEVDD